VESKTLGRQQIYGRQTAGAACPKNSHQTLQIINPVSRRIRTSAIPAGKLLLIEWGDVPAPGVVLPLFAFLGANF